MNERHNAKKHVSNTLDSRSRAYMFGHGIMSKAELQLAKAKAESDPDLKGSLRHIVLQRFDQRIKGQTF